MNIFIGLALFSGFLTVSYLVGNQLNDKSGIQNDVVADMILGTSIVCGGLIVFGCILVGCLALGNAIAGAL